MAKIYTPQEALAKMRLLCSRAEHSAGEIKEKLRKMGLSSGDINTVIQWLKSNRYVDDDRFAEAFVRDKYLFSKWGRRKIAFALAGKGIAAEAIRNALDVIDEDEYVETAKKLAKAKSRGKTELTFEDKNKIYRWLLSRGFESYAASAGVKGLLNTEI